MTTCLPLRLLSLSRVSICEALSFFAGAFGKFSRSLSKPPPDLPRLGSSVSLVIVPFSAWSQVLRIMSGVQRGSPIVS